MADTKISDLPAASSVSDPDVVPIVQSAANKKAAFSTISTYLGGIFALITRAISTSGSLTGGGDLSTDRTLSLVNDADTPGNSKYYGTDGAGAKGYHDLPPGDGDVHGPGSSTDSDFVQFDGTDGKHIKDGGLSLDIDGTLAADSDSRIASQKAVKTYVDATAGAPPDASSTVKGITKLSVDPAVSTDPIAFGANDPAVVLTGDSRLSDDRTANALRTATAKSIATDADPTDTQLLGFDAAAGKWKPVDPPSATIPDNIKKNSVAFGKKRASGISVAVLDFVAVAAANGTIIGWFARVDAACTIKFRKANAAEPGTGDRINTSGLAVSSGLTISTTLTDFTTTAVAVDDVIIPEITAITGTLTTFETGLIIQKT